MTNVDKVSAALSEWGFKVAKSVLPNISIPANSKLGHLMGMIGVNPATYSIWNELGFLAEPIIQTMVTPAVQKMLSGIPDEQIPDLARKYVDAFVKQAHEKGSVNVFGIELGANAFEGLRDILNQKL